MKDSIYDLLLAKKRNELKKIIYKSDKFDILLDSLSAFVSNNDFLRKITRGLNADDDIYSFDFTVRSLNVIDRYIRSKIVVNGYHVPYRIKSVFEAVSEEGLIETKDCGVKTIQDIKIELSKLRIKLKKKVTQENWDNITLDVKEYSKSPVQELETILEKKIFKQKIDKILRQPIYVTGPL